MVMRQQVWIDRHVQGVLVGRVLLYWSGLVLYFGLSTGCFQWWQNPEWTLGDHASSMFDQIWPYLPTMFLLLPLVIFDIVRLSNRFVGPIYRLRVHLNELQHDSSTSPLSFRDDDYWQQLAEPINIIQHKLLTLEQQIETLSFVHKSLAEVPQPSGPTDAEVASHADKFVALSDSLHSTAPVTPPSALPTSALPEQPQEPFVTLSAN